MVTAFNVGDVDSFMESFAPFIISCMCTAKFFNFIFNGEQMRSLLNMMRDDWKIYSASSNELEILSRHYAVGKRITLNYATFLYGSMTPFMMMPSLQNAASTLGFFNLSGERAPLMYRVEHFVDAEKYYYPLLIHSYFGTVAFITIVVACDSMILLYVQHECALCEILRDRLRNFVDHDNMDIELHPSKHEDRPYKNARTCIMLHKHIIEFAQKIENANTVSFLFQLGFNLMGVSFTQFQAIANLDRPNKSLSFGSFTTSLLSILLLDSWRGQQVLDSTDNIFEYTTSGKWYQSSMNSKKLLSIMLTKSVVPIKLTAGRLYTLNLENFTAVVKTSFSYCMVLCSFQ
ncbi:odorant receptor 13a-like [Colletes gigas]|uniref:odorant receptor 13a-like n=1 Tax=Colletes gigas TaxID=935657 RepID=UPI001C9B03AE|nr:odorant receptor 13a-like [Colletes gigas]